MPARSEIEPSGIRRGLDNCFILERIAPGSGRFRLAGRHLIDLMGMEVRGMPLCALFHPTSRGRLSDVLESVFRAPQLAQIQMHSKSDYGRPELTGRMLLMPLRSDLGDVTRALGCLVATGETGVAPRRFDLVADQVMPIIEGGTTVEPSPATIGAPPGAGKLYPRPPRVGAGASRDAVDAPPDTTDDLPPATPEARRALFRVVTTPKR